MRTQIIKKKGVEFDGACYRCLPESVAGSVSQRVHTLSDYAAGGRVRFCTGVGILKGEV